jgi:hypothetical protein
MRALLCLVAILGGCAVGAPPGFSKGDSWGFPLVAPLEDDVLLVPVHVENRAEAVLFMIDPDSAVSSIDSALQNELKPYSRQVPHQLNERDQRVPVFMAELKRMRVGELEIENIRVRVHKVGTFWAGGRRVRGILGRDVLADSLLLSLDRDRGVGILATQGGISPPRQAHEISFRAYFHRRIAKVKVNGRHELDMHLDLGARTTMLWAEQIQKAGLPKLNVRAELQDEYGTTWTESSGGLAAMVEIAGARVDAIVVLPYGDLRVEKGDLDGALGQNFFSRFNVIANWHERKMWLRKRTTDLIGTAPERLRRWGRAFEGCTRAACVKVELVRGDAAPAPGATPPPGATPAPGGATAPARGPFGAAPPPAAPPAPASGGAAPTPPADPQPDTAAQPGTPAPPSGPNALREIRIVREPRGVHGTYEVLLEAVREDGEPLGLPRLRATLMAGAQTVSDTQLAPQYDAAAAFLVVDASPFPRECEMTAAGQRCMFQQASR